MPTLIEYVFEAADADLFSVYARDDEEAFEKAQQEAARMGLHDCPLRCVDAAPYDPSGGDGPED